MSTQWLDSPVLEDPPPSRRSKVGGSGLSFIRRLEVCMTEPGRWFKVATSNNLADFSTAAYRIRQAHALPGSWDAAARLVDGVPTLYVMWKGFE